MRVGLEEEAVHGADVTGPLVVGRVLSVVTETHRERQAHQLLPGRRRGAQRPGRAECLRGRCGAPASRGIVCGAHNFVVGDRVVVALPGAVLPGPFPIAARKTYGHVSDGMICSARELGLGDDHAGIIVLTELGFDARDLAVGQDALELLGLGERTVEINVTPDRGYCFSMRGVAREYCHCHRAPLPRPCRAVDVAGADGGRLPGRGRRRGADPRRVGCDRFVARIVRGVDASAPTPLWMQRRLTQAGMRPISLAVDVTNYVMLDLGQPLHAYDLPRVAGPIVVRRAAAGEHAASPSTGSTGRSTRRTC